MTERLIMGERSDVLFVSMPWGPLLQPSLGLSLLKATLNGGVRSEIRYFTLDFARIIGPEAYITIANGAPTTSDLVGEWIFSPTLFDRDSTADQTYVDEVLLGDRPDLFNEAAKHRAAITDEFLTTVYAARDAAPAFIADCASHIAQRAPRILGFTSVFQQNVASLALAKSIKDQCPDTVIVFGGANCEGQMGVELLRQFAFVDVVMSGEGERAFPVLVEQILSKEQCDQLTGVYTQESAPTAREPFLNSPRVSDMDTLPYPSYDDYFTQLAAAALATSDAPRLLFETSRGCWWGEKHHCTFCGLNGASMAFTSKSAQRAFDEVNSLSQKHPNLKISVVDNILDMKYLQDFVPMLSSGGLELDLFYEVKANLKRHQLVMLRDAGIRSIQPGIESFSTQVLSLMNKGVRGIQNIQLLKWCKELGIRAYWNMLWGFPGESPAEYQLMADLVPALAHLQPPVSGSVIRLDRFSPNFDNAEALGFANVKPHASYSHIYPLEQSAVAGLAYYFVFDYAQPQPVGDYTRSLSEAIERWQRTHDESDLFMVDKNGLLMIWDLRAIALQPLTVLTGIGRAIYLACDSARPISQLPTLLSSVGDNDCGDHSIHHYVDMLVERKLMLRDGGMCLSLAVRLGDYTPSHKVTSRFCQLLRELGTEHHDITTISVDDEVMLTH
ncbi:RiPP maturation radical SAM C-methyltransferase [Mycobacterium sp. ACS1612]|uniref:RiPP maturation radical SAM C-methyltransferase n=1 Tax=Mycobacterium sp. ACS1612 TaxID=1834117 RepID=UPI000ADB2616|nr:RiPP maturation radical SAM C-methyltransferase [Mycobacterium sp. ACS1612]